MSHDRDVDRHRLDDRDPLYPYPYPLSPHSYTFSDSDSTGASPLVSPWAHHNQYTVSPPGAGLGDHSYYTSRSYSTSSHSDNWDSPMDGEGHSHWQYHHLPSTQRSSSYTYQAESIHGMSAYSYSSTTPYSQGMEVVARREYPPPTGPQSLTASSAYRSRPGSVSSHYSHHAPGSRHSSNGKHHSHSRSYEMGQEISSSNSLMPPAREHRRRSGSRSSTYSESHHSEDSHQSRHSSRSHSPIPPQSHSPYYSSSNPSPNPSFIQPAPGQPIVLPIGRHAKHGYVVVPATGQNVTVIPVRSPMTVQYLYGSSDVQGRIEEVPSGTYPSASSTKSRLKTFFSMK